MNKLYILWIRFAKYADFGGKHCLLLSPSLGFRFSSETPARDSLKVGSAQNEAKVSQNCRRKGKFKEKGRV